MFSWSRTVVLVWASVWMLLVPLFHVHPEADHRHGEAGHSHGGTIHTVWSQDLGCEFDGHQHGDHAGRSTHDRLANVAQSPHAAGDGHVELNFSVLNDSTDRKSFKLFVVQALAFTPAEVLDADSSARIQRHRASVQPSAPGSVTHSPRAPPSFLL